MHEKMTRSRFFEVWAKILVFFMMIQGLPLGQLSQAYEYRFDLQRIEKFLDFFGPSEAQAAPPQVICVPQLPTDLLVPHDTWSGEPTVLKGISRDPDGNLSGGTYYWEYGDGSQSAPAAITNASNLSVTHTYTADPGTLIVARLHVADAAGEAASDEYRVIVREKNLDVEVNKAIDDGLWWLYKNKQAIGSNYRWNNIRYGNHYNNTTASAVQAFEINGHLETGDRNQDPYVDVVSGGLRYLFTQMRTYNIGMQSYGNPDTNGNGIGITVTGDRQIYELGAVMDAIVATGTPDTIAVAGGANIIGRRYQDVVQDMVDMYAWGQYDSATVGGGWRYSWNQAPDNSAAQWGAIGMIAAERYFGCTIPQWVKDRNSVWLNNSYNSAGYFGYTGRSANRTYTTGPSGMVQLSFDGFDTTDTRWHACEVYLEDHWSGFIQSNRDARYYSYYPMAKAMRLALPQEVTHLPNGLDWYGDETRGLARILVNRQNSSGYWPYDGWPYVGEQTAAAWNIIVLTRTLFEKPPVAIIKAEPNPGALGQQIQLDASESYHVDPAKQIVEYLWDFDASDGVDFANPDAVGITAAAAYGALGDYQVSLQVVDDSDPPRFDVGNLTIHITIPPHPPTAVVSGPYIAVMGEEIQLDGSGSYDVDEPEGDSITAWDWETDFVAPYDFAEASGQVVTIPGFDQPGHYDIALRVTDNTAAVFPSSGSPNLTHAAFGRVTVYNTNITDLAARPKATKCQLTWTHAGAALYEVMRSEAGPNHGFVVIGTTDSTYSTYLDYNVEMFKNYWYRIRCELNGETVLSGPVHVNSQGRIRNLPPEITTTAVTAAQEGQLYSYDVDAVDPEGTALTYILDQAPDGMSIDPATGLVNWTPTFDQVGVVDVTVRVDDALRASDAQFFQIVVQPRPNTAPVAALDGPYSGLIDTSVAFDASDSVDPDGDPIVLYHWVFGDGSEGYGAQIGHIYTAPNIYTVTLYVTDDRGATASVETTCQIEAPNQMPTALIAGPAQGEAGLPMAFNALNSTDPDGDPMTYSWNFGDSSPAESAETVIHTYAQEGNYTLSLTVDDGRGGMNTAEMEVIVTPPNQPPTAVFSVTGSLTRLETLTFDATASFDPEGQPVTSYDWDFGDGSTTTGQIVTHVFDSVGAFVVTLTVTDDQGAEGTVQQNLTIGEIMVTVPDVAARLQTEAQTLITNADLTVGIITPQASESVPAGSVISQDPVAGTSVEINSAVNITVSTGPPMIIVPDVVNMARAAAEAAILATGLTVGTVTLHSSATLPQGAVMGQNPAAGTSIVIHSAVDLAVSIGDHEIVNVPNVAGLPQADALAVITDAGLAVGTVTQQYSSTVPADHVISMNPLPGTSVIDTTPIDIVVSLGVQMVTVPSVVGQDQAAASAAITSVGLTVGTRTDQMELSVPENQVLVQNPAGGSSVPIGTAVDLTVAVHSDIIAPQVGISLSANPVGPGQYTRITVTASDNLGVTQIGLTVDGVVQTLDANNQCLYQAGGEGTEAISATARDAAGNLGSATADLVVSAAGDTNPPSVSMTYSPSAPAVGETIHFTISAADDAGVDLGRIWLQVDGIYLPVTNGQADYVANRQGNIPAIASAYDLYGNYAQDVQIIPVSVAGSNTPAPTVQITSPANESEILGRVDIVGTADDADLAYYTLSYRLDGESDFVEYYRSEQPVTDDVLGVLDGTSLENGMYTILLRAFDIHGTSGSDSVQVYVSGEQKIGNFTLSFTDMQIDLSGIDIEVVRTYDSRVKTRRDFGVGWSLAIKQNARLSENVAPGSGWETYCTRSLFGSCFEWGVRQSRDHDVTIEIPGVRKQEFNASVVVSYANPGGIAQGHIRFDAKPGTYTTLEPLDNVTFDLMQGGELLDLDFNTINPNRYRLTLLDGTQFYYDQSAGAVYRIVDPNGNSVNIAAAGITHSSGAQVQFIRDAIGRITSIEDSDGRLVEYTYDELGDLKSSTDPNGNMTRYKYAVNHYLDEVIDPRGISAVRTEYDGDGRMIHQINADGEEVVFDYDIDNQRQSVTDFAGNTTTFEYDDNGNVTSKSDTQGNTWTYSYDARNNLLKTINPDGTSTIAAYDAKDNKLSETDELGNTTFFTYNSMGLLTSSTDALGRISQTEYDTRGNLVRTIGPDMEVLSEHTYDSQGKLLTISDALGNTTTYTYDARGHIQTETDALGNTITYTNDNRGNVLSRVNARGFTTTYTYDANNNLLTETDALGNTVSNTYTSYDKIQTITDERGHITEYVYDAFGQHVQTIYPDGRIESMAYDVNGNRTHDIDADGRATVKEYDSENRLLSTEYADGSVLQNEYNARGFKTAVIDALGNRTEYEFDGAGRNVLIRDALGNETVHSYDAVGNLVATIDALNRVTEFDYDVYNRKTVTTYPDGTTYSQAFDNSGRKIAETDQAGVTTQFEYDPLGRIVRVIDAIGGETTYTYDAAGNKVSQTDSIGRTTFWVYDALNRVQSNNLPGGEVEVFDYDESGNVISHTDFNGDITIFQHSACCGRLLSKSFQDGSSVEYTYTGTGKQDTVTDIHGTTNYSYDLRDRLVSITDPEGNTISYTYDANGNRTSVSTPTGTTAYTFDALNRLLTVSDSDGGVTTYQYDDLGNRITTSYPNGTIAEYGYDMLSRLIYLENRSSDGGVISSYAYTLGAAGYPLQVVEHSGRTVTYTYDALYRIVQEEIIDGVLGNETINFTYDAFGNRLTKTDSGGAVHYTYNANDRLLSEAGPLSDLTYTYDANGNTLTKSDGVEVTNYFYNYENRLSGIQTAASTISYEYDPDGIRIGSTVDGAVTKYIVDKNRNYAQVLEERDETGALIVEYVYGDKLIRQRRGGEVRYYLFDGQMSTRQLIDADEAVTDQYTFNAFGQGIDLAGATANNYLYTGEQYDPNAGFYYLRARYYEQEAGRFLTSDTWQGDMLAPLTLNKYLYAGASPVMYNDPSGNMFSLGGLSISLSIQNNLRATRGAQAYQSYKRVRRGLCIAAAVTMTNAHHAVPMFMGGGRSWRNNIRIDLPANFHGEFHLLLHYMLRMVGLPGGMGKSGSAEAYRALFKKNPATRAAAHQILIMASRIFDKQCASKIGFKVTPIIKRQIKMGKWDF